MSKLEKGVIMQTIKYQICIVTTLQSFYYMHRFLRLTTYLTPTSGGANGNNGEIGLKTTRKGSKTAEKRPKTGIGRLVVCLGASSSDSTSVIPTKIAGIGT